LANIKAKDSGSHAAAITVPTEQQKNADALCLSLHALGTLCKIIGRYTQAIEHFTHAYTIASKVHGKDNLHSVRAESQIAELLCSQGKYKEAYTIFRRCLDTAEILTGTSSTTTISVLQYVGYTAAMCGDFAMAKDSHSRAIQARQHYEKPSERDPDLERAQTYLLAEAYLFLAHYEGLTGDTARAVATTKMAVEYMDRYELVRVPEFALGLNFALCLLGQAMIEDGQNGEAFSNFRKAVDMARTQSTKEYVNIELACMEVELGAVLWNFNLNRSDARETTLQALTVFKTGLGELHPYTLQTSLNYMSMFESVPGKYDLMTVCASKLSEQLNPLHPSSLSATEMLGHFLYDTGHPQEALEMLLSLDEALQKVGKGFDAMVERVLSRITNLSAVLGKRIDTGIVERTYKYTKTLQSKHGEWSTEVIPMLLVLSKAYHVNAEFDRTHHYLTKALKIADKYNMIFLLGHLFRSASQLTPAEVNERNRMAEERMSSGMTLQFANILYCIGVTYESQGKLRDAELTYMQSLAAFEIAGQPNHPGACIVLDAIGSLLFIHGHFGDAMCYFEKAFTVRDDAAYDKSGPLRPYKVGASLLENGTRIDRHITIVAQELWKRGYCLQRHMSSRVRFAVYI